MAIYINSGCQLRPVASCRLPVAGYFARTVIPAYAGISHLGALVILAKAGIASFVAWCAMEPVPAFGDDNYSEVWDPDFRQDDSSGVNR